MQQRYQQLEQARQMNQMSMGACAVVFNLLPLGILMLTTRCCSCLLAHTDEYNKQVSLAH